MSKKDWSRRRLIKVKQCVTRMPYVQRTENKVIECSFPLSSSGPSTWRHPAVLLCAEVICYMYLCGGADRLPRGVLEYIFYSFRHFPCIKHVSLLLCSRYSIILLHLLCPLPLSLSDNGLCTWCLVFYSVIGSHDMLDYTQRYAE